MEDFPKPIKVKIFYDEELKKITGKDSEETIASEGINFVTQLYFIFSSYPEIQKKFPPGQLGFLLNGKAPQKNDVLKNGDKLEFLIFKIEDIRKDIEFQLRGIINYYQIDTTFEEIKEMVFNEDGREDFKKIVRLFTSKINGDNLNEINDILKFVNAGWNYFPH